MVAHNLSVNFYPLLSLSLNMSPISRASALRTFVHDLRRIRLKFGLKAVPLLISLLFTQLRLDYCNFLFLNLEFSHLKRLKIIKNSLARAVTRTPSHRHISPILKTLQ